MDIQVRYFTKTGNTKIIADAIAEHLGAQSHPLDVPVPEGTRMLFLGCSVYAFDIPQEVRGFIQGLSGVSQIALFSTSALVKAPYGKIKKLTQANGIALAESFFHCRGQFRGMHNGRPNTEDIANAVKFASDLVR